MDMGLELLVGTCWRLASGMAQVLYAAENDMRLRRGQKESPLG